MFKPHPAASEIVTSTAKANSSLNSGPGPGPGGDGNVGQSTPTRQGSPATDLTAIRPVVSSADGIDYVPSAPWSGVPGCGVANLAYIPDFLVSAPVWYAGNAIPVKHALVEVQRPYAVVASKQVLEGVGGLVSGSTALQSLVEVEYNTNNQSETGA